VKRLIACVSLVAAASTAAMPATTPHAANVSAKSPVKAPAKPAKSVAKAPKCRVAPADEYFGKLKLSILGIRNTIKDQGLKVDYDPQKAPSTLNAIALTEDAIHDWERKYPCDSWLPGTVYALQHFYAKLHTDDGVKRVHATFAWLRKSYPKSKFVQVAQREDGEATAIPPGPAPTSVDATTAAASPAPGTPSASVAQPGPAATPFPGTAPQSVINAQNAMGASPSPGPKPH
jgi:hypothetical protein